MGAVILFYKNIKHQKGIRNPILELLLLYDHLEI
jgi:hypothetical protein